MSAWRDRILYVNTSDPELRRRGNMLIGVTLTLTALAMAFIPVIISSGRGPTSLLIIIVSGLIFLSAAYLGRIGQVTVGSYLVIAVAALAILAAIYVDHSNPGALMYLVLVILLAGVLLPAGQTWAALAITLIGMFAVFSQLPPEVQADPTWRTAQRGAPLILVMATLLMYFSARSVRSALEEARSARAQAEAANTRLAESNSTLETRVAERTAELSQAVEQQLEATRQLEQSLAAQRDMNQVIAELSVPIIPISRDSLVVPLVGAIDSSRAEQLLSSLLTTIEQAHARTIILDVTGVAVIDTQVAAVLMRVAAAARLMGAATMLVGIRPEVAQTLVGLGVDLNTIRTAASLQDGMSLITAR